MRIGETEISVFNAKQHRVSIDHMTIRNNSEWQSGSTLPYITGSQFDFKTITIELTHFATITSDAQPSFRWTVGVNPVG